MAKRVQVDRDRPKRRLEVVAAPVSTYSIPEYTSPNVGAGAKALADFFGGAAEVVAAKFARDDEARAKQAAVDARADFLNFSNKIKPKAYRMDPSQVDGFLAGEFEKHFGDTLNNPETPFYNNALADELQEFTPKAIEVAAKNAFEKQVQNESDAFGVNVQGLIDDALEKSSSQEEFNTELEALIDFTFDGGNSNLDRTSLNSVAASVGADLDNQDNRYILNWMRSRKLDSTQNAAYERPVNTMRQYEASRVLNSWEFDIKSQVDQLVKDGRPLTIKEMSEEIMAEGRARGMGDFNWINTKISQAEAVLADQIEKKQVEAFKTATVNAIIMGDGILPTGSLDIPGTDKSLSKTDIEAAISSEYTASFMDLMFGDEEFFNNPDNAKRIARAERVAQVVIPRIKVPSIEAQFTAAARDLVNFDTKEAPKTDEWRKLSLIASHVQKYGGKTALKFQLGERNYNIWQQMEFAEQNNVPAETIAKSLANPEPVKIDNEAVKEMSEAAIDPDRNTFFFDLLSWDVKAPEISQYRDNWIRNNYRLLLGTGVPDSPALRQKVAQNFIDAHAYIEFEDGVATLPVKDIDLLNALADRKLNPETNKMELGNMVDAAEMEERLSLVFEYAIDRYIEDEIIAKDSVLFDDASFQFSPHPTQKKAFQMTDILGNTLKTIRYQDVYQQWLNARTWKLNKDKEYAKQLETEVDIMP